MPSKFQYQHKYEEKKTVIFTEKCKLESIQTRAISKSSRFLCKVGTKIFLFKFKKKEEKKGPSPYSFVLLLVMAKCA